MGFGGVREWALGMYANGLWRCGKRIVEICANGLWGMKHKGREMRFKPQKAVAAGKMDRRGKHEKRKV